MGLGAIIKRHKGTLVNFQDSFLIPMVKMSAVRYMQLDPETYPVADYTFEVTSSLGIIARECEMPLVQLLQTMGTGTPMYPLLVEAIHREHESGKQKKSWSDSCSGLPARSATSGDRSGSSSSAGSVGSIRRLTATRESESRARRRS